MVLTPQFAMIAAIPPTSFDPIATLLLAIAVTIMHVVMIVWGGRRLAPSRPTPTPPIVRPAPTPRPMLPATGAPNNLASDSPPQRTEVDERLRKLDEILKTIEMRLKPSEDKLPAELENWDLDESFKTEMKELLALAEGLKSELGRLASRAKRVEPSAA